MKRSLFVVLCLSLGACDKPQQTKPTQAPAATPETPAAASETESAPVPASARTSQDSYPEIQVQLLDAGAEPRSALRFAPQAGQQVKVESSVDTVSATFVGDRQVAQTHSPSIVHSIDAKILSASKDQFEVDWTSAYSAKNAPKVNPKELEKAQAKYAAQGPTHGVLTFNDRGQRLASRFDKGSEDQMRWAANLVIPWPKEPVGVGARWETELDSPLEGIDCVVKTQYTLKAIKDGKVTLELASVTTGKPGPFSSPDVPPGVELELISMKVEFKGEQERDIARFYQEKAQLNGTRELVMKIKANGQVQEIRTSSQLKSTVTFSAQ